MPECKSFQEKMFDYVDGLLPTGARKDVVRHLEECLDCSKIYENVTKVRWQLRNLNSIKVSPDFETVLRTRISMERSLSRRSFLNRPIRIPVYAATGALAFLAAFFILNVSDKQLNNNSAPLKVSSSVPSSQFSTNQTVPSTQNTPQKINYPMDRLNLSGGTTISSRSLERQTSTLTDSVSEVVPERRIQPVVGVEF
jgi:hypothetical protein